MSEQSSSHGMSLIVQTVTRWIKGFIFLFGIYVTIFGHVTPGGGFTGGVIIACALILITLAFGKEAILNLISRKKSGRLLRLLAALSLLYFIGIALKSSEALFPGILRGKFIGDTFHIASAGHIFVSNIEIGFKVASALFLVFITLSIFRIANDKDSDAANEHRE